MKKVYQVLLKLVAALIMGVCIAAAVAYLTFMAVMGIIAVVIVLGIAVPCYWWYDRRYKRSKSPLAS